FYEPPHNGTQAHHIEVRPADDAGADFARLAQADHREAYGGEVAERGQGLDPLAQILDLRNRERGVLDAYSRRALTDVDQAALVAIDQRAQQYAAYQAENGGIGAYAKGQRDDHGERQALGSDQRTDGEFQIA